MQVSAVKSVLALDLAHGRAMTLCISRCGRGCAAGLDRGQPRRGGRPFNGRRQDPSDTNNNIIHSRAADDINSSAADNADDGECHASFDYSPSKQRQRHRRAHRRHRRRHPVGPRCVRRRDRIQAL